MRATGRGILIVGIMLSVFSVAFQMIGLATALPTVMSSFGAERLYPWAFTTMVSGMLASTILAGLVADRWGPALPMYFGFAMFAIGLALGWWAPSVWFILLARAVQGLGAGALNLTLSFIVAHGFPEKERARAMALVSFCWVLPAFVGPPIAAWLTSIDWRLVFAAMLPLVLAAIIFTAPGLLQVQRAFEPDPEVDRPAVAATIAVTLAPSLILLAGQGFGLWSIASAVVGVLALGWGLPRILAPATLGLGAGIPSVVLTRAIQAGSFFAAETIILVTLQQLRGFSVAEAGWSLTVGSLGWSVGSWLQSRPRMTLRRDAYLSLGAALSTTGILGLAIFAWIDSLPLWFALTAWVVAGLGMGFTMPSSAVIVMSLSSALEQGRNQSSMQVAESVGNSVLTAVTGGIYTALLVAKPAALGYTLALGTAALASGAAIWTSRRAGRIANELNG